MYIIENATILKDKQFTTNSLLISENRIERVGCASNYYRIIRMNVEDFIMTPSFVIYSPSLPSEKPYSDWKKWMIQNVLLQGCTTLFTYIDVRYEADLSKKIAEMKTALMNSPIDYLFGVKVSARIVTPSFVRACKREKIPAIFVTIQKSDELDTIPWGWIREALFPFNCPLIPIISENQKEGKAVLSKWKDITEKEKIPSIHECLIENQPLPKSILNKIGIYPQKSSLMNNAELSYNLYFKSREIMNVDEVHLFHYHSDRLAVTVDKGKIIRSGAEVLFRPGNGEHVKVQTPSFFSL